jgi:hypothetical protein
LPCTTAFAAAGSSGTPLDAGADGGALAGLRMPRPPAYGASGSAADPAASLPQPVVVADALPASAGARAPNSLYVVGGPFAGTCAFAWQPEPEPSPEAGPAQQPAAAVDDADFVTLAYRGSTGGTFTLDGLAPAWLYVLCLRQLRFYVTPGITPPRAFNVTLSRWHEGHGSLRDSGDSSGSGSGSSGEAANGGSAPAVVAQTVVETTLTDCAHQPLPSVAPLLQLRAADPPAGDGGEASPPPPAAQPGYVKGSTAPALRVAHLACTTYAAGAGELRVPLWSSLMISAGAPGAANDSHSGTGSHVPPTAGTLSAARLSAGGYNGTVHASGGSSIGGRPALAVAPDADAGGAALWAFWPYGNFSARGDLRCHYDGYTLTLQGVARPPVPLPALLTGYAPAAAYTACLRSLALSNAGPVPTGAYLVSLQAQVGLRTFTAPTLSAPLQVQLRVQRDCSDEGSSWRPPSEGGAGGAGGTSSAARGPSIAAAAAAAALVAATGKLGAGGW